MIYYSFFYSEINNPCAEKNEIVKTVLEDCYKEKINENDIVIATNEITVRFGPNNLKINDIRQQNPDKKIILFFVDMSLIYFYQLNFENHLKENKNLLDCIDEIWTTEYDHVKVFEKFHKLVKFCNLPHTNRLQQFTNVKNPDIDVLLYGSLDIYNTDLLKFLINCNLTVGRADNLKILNSLLPRSKIVLLTNGKDKFYQEQTKIRYLISNKKCVLSNISIKNNFPQVIEKSDNELIDTIYWLLENDNWKNYIAEEKMSTENPNLKNKTKKIVMMSMFQNEAKTIGRMLQSCYQYIDYWVLQDNGSTDGTPQVVEEFFKDKNIPGFIYRVEEGWVGFGWNRDHLIQTVRKTDHGCDWILKMDCDETLVVDSDFDWSIFDNTEIQSFHVPALVHGILYQRAWIYNAQLPFRFNHDDAHETSYIEGPIGQGFQRVDLPISFRHETFDDGQSYGVRTKYLTDALKLEERLIREETLLSDRYHFWYIGKSYYDCYRGDFYPLGTNHSEEFARRSIWYFDEWLNVNHNYSRLNTADGIDEMAYYALMLNGLTYSYLNNRQKAIDCFIRAGAFSPPRNEHLMRLAELYQRENDFHSMYEVVSFMIDPQRINPFPEYHFMIENNCYHNTSNYLQELLTFSTQKIVEFNNKNNIQPVQSQTQQTNYNLSVSNNMKKRLFVVDNFYQNPDDVRNFALSLEFGADIRWYKGLRSKTNFKPEGLKESFESIIGEKITVWDEHQYNGCFQITTAEDPQVYHHDVQKWAAMIYLTPDAPLESGTRTHRSKISGARHATDTGIDQAFAGGFIDSTKFDIVDNAANVYNRLVIMDAQCIHSAGPYFGTDNKSGRLIHLFFFD